MDMPIWTLRIGNLASPLTSLEWLQASCLQCAVRCLQEAKRKMMKHMPELASASCMATVYRT